MDIQVVSLVVNSMVRSGLRMRVSGFGAGSVWAERRAAASSA